MDGMRTIIQHLDADGVIDLWRFTLTLGGEVESCKRKADGEFAMLVRVPDPELRAYRRPAPLF